MAYGLYVFLLIFLVILAIFTYLGAKKNQSPYGRHLTDNQKTMAALPAWLLFESPQVFAFTLTFWLTATTHAAPAIFLYVLWQSHYLYRAIIYPLRRNDKGKRFPVTNVVFGFIFNLVNGYVNGYAVSHAEHLMNNDWFTNPLFLLGLSIAIAGWVINFKADNILINLRSDGSTGYKIPFGGMFKYVSSANYLGEIMLWFGWAFMSWTPAGWVFVLFTMANLVPRAQDNHRWFLEKFPDYPKDRKAVFPGIL